MYTSLQKAQEGRVLEQYIYLSLQGNICLFTTCRKETTSGWLRVPLQLANAYLL